jgi:hypothetical protein
VLIKEATGATVTAVGLRADGIDPALNVAYARGADRVVAVDAGDLDPYDTRTAALAFAEAFRQLSPDLILIGVQTPYDIFGQTAPLVVVGRRRTSSSRSTSPTAPPGSSRSTPAAGWPCSACNCRPWSGCSRRASPRATCRWAACARR